MTPIPIAEFQQGKEPSSEPRGATVWPKIEKFLQENSETAYRPSEVAETLELIPATVNNTMNKKWKDGILDKKSVDSHVYYRWLGKQEGAKEEESESEPEPEPNDPEEGEEEEEEEEYEEEEE